MSKVTQIVSDIARPVVEGLGCELWDVEYVKEAGTWYLRIYIDKEGGVGIDECEAVSRALDPILDEIDPISESYVFEVGSPGIERELKRPSDFDNFLGSEVEVKTYKPVNGSKSFIGELKDYSDGNITVRIGNSDVCLIGADVAQVRLHVSF